MPTPEPVASPEIVVMTTYSAPSDDKADSMTWKQAKIIEYISHKLRLTYITLKEMD